MSNALEGFINKKTADSLYLSLKNGESIIIKKLISITPNTKLGFDGKPKDVLDFLVEVETSEGDREKLFQNGTMRFAKEAADKLGTNPIGCGFTLTRIGEQAQTRYTISNVVLLTDKVE